MNEKRNYIDKDIRQVGYRMVDVDNYQDFYITKLNDDCFYIEYAEKYHEDGIHANLRMTRQQLEELMHNIQEQLLNNKWVPRK